MNEFSDFSDRIAASSAELLNLYRQNRPPEAEKPPVAETPQPPAQEPAPPVNTVVPEFSSVGYLQVQTTAAEMSVPVAGALVVVTAGDRLVALGETDQSGLSDLWTLPAPDPLDFERPDPTALPAFYSVAVYADGYASVLNRQVPLYGSVKSMQEVNLIPLPEAVSDVEYIFTTGAPVDLQ